MKKHISFVKLTAACSVIAVSFLIASLPAAARYVGSYRTHSRGSLWQIPIIIGMIVVVNVVSVLIYKAKHKPKISNDDAPKNYTERIRSEITGYDPKFSEYYLIRMGEGQFERLVSAVSDREIDSLRPFETEELYQRQKTETEDLLSAGRIRILSHAKINRSFLHLYRRDANYEYVTVCLDVQIKDYIITQNDYRLVDGKKELQKQYYLLTYMRSKPSKGDAAAKRIQTNCPNCGAPIQLNSSRQCAFCQAIIKADVFDWVLYDVEVLGEMEKADNRGILIEDNANVVFTKEDSQYFTGYYDNGINDPYLDPFTRSEPSQKQYDVFRAGREFEQSKINTEFSDSRSHPF